ncbi:MAG: hypothetical protein Q4C77_03405 [Eubacteriales bacterium]|nr:hypothetical protein [Eubacteriales bacterium]
MKNSIKQMLRTPVRTILFFVLLTFAALLMTLGASLWIKNEKTAAEYEKQFITIGTVRQKPKSFEQNLVWDAGKKDYQILRRAQYDSYFTVDDLKIPGVEFLAGPEQRAYYGSWIPDYVSKFEAENATGFSCVAEFSPLEDCRPDESVQVKITKVLGKDTTMENSVVFFCEHDNPQPDMLYKDKTYVAYLAACGLSHGKTYEKAKEASPMLDISVEYGSASIASELYQPDGSRIEDEFRDGQTIFEVADGFYDTAPGKRLLDLAETIGYSFHTQPVTGTSKTCLLMPFYNGESYISEGRDIDQEEYENGSKVCLVPRNFMENNNLSLGDKIKVQLFYTNTRRNAGADFCLDGSGSSYQIIDEKGNKLEPFETSDYMIVGIYDTRMGSGDYAFRSGADELIVPIRSIESGVTENLVACGPMSDATTSFQIPNGSIEDFQKKWAEHGTSDLEITFHDMGYSRLKAGIDNMRNLSLFFLIVGVILTMLLLFFFSHLFITKQAKRTAIERSFGMTRSQCRWSLLSGILLLVLLGSIAGSVGGAYVSRNISSENTGKVYYDSTFSVGASGTEEDVGISDIGVEMSEWMAFGCAAIIVLAAAGIAITKINKRLRREPMELLRDMQKE